MPKKSMFPTPRWVCRATHQQSRPSSLTLPSRSTPARHNTPNEMYHARARVHLDRRCINQIARHLRQGSHQPSRQRRTTNICVVAQDIGNSEIANDAGGSHRMRFTMRTRVDSMAIATNKPRTIYTRGQRCRTTNNLVVARDIGRAEGGLQRPCHQSLRRGATLMPGKSFVDTACWLLLQGRCLACRTCPSQHLLPQLN